MNKALSETYVTDGHPNMNPDWLEANFPIGCTVAVISVPSGNSALLGEVRAHFTNILNEHGVTIRWDNGKEDDFDEDFLRRGPIARV